jgi:hypothetical protein
VIDLYSLYVLLTEKGATAIGSTVVAVRCERCKHKYYYELTRSARGYGSSKEQARRRAEVSLRWLLECDVEPVPCPHCGWWQREMIPVVRERRQRGTLVWGLAGLIAATFAGWAALFLMELRDTWKVNVAPSSVPLFGTFAALAAAGGIGLLFVREYKKGVHNPNDPATELERIDLGRQLTLTPEQVEEWARAD